MPTTCKECGNAVSRNLHNSNNMIVCNTPTCSSIHHTKCVGIQQDDYNAVRNTWTCSKCQISPNGTELSDIIAKFTELKSDLKTVKDAVGKIECKMEEVVKIGEVVLANERDIRTLRAENIALKKDVNRLDALSRQNNIVVTGLPENSNENLPEIVSAIGSKLGITVNRDSIVKCSRFRSKTGKDKPILVIFTSFIMKANFMNGFKNILNSKLIGKDIGLNSTDKIRIGNHLTSSIQRLFHITKNELVQSGIYKYAWIQNGSILIRKTSTSKILKVKCEADVGKLIVST